MNTGSSKSIWVHGGRFDGGGGGGVGVDFRSPEVGISAFSMHLDT